MILRESFGYIQSDKNRHFSGQILSNGSEYEDLRFGGSVSRYSDRDPNTSAASQGQAKCFLTSVVLQTATDDFQDWTVAFYSKDVHYQALDATPYDGALLGYVHLSAAEVWPTASQYFYSTAFQAIAYLDEDNTNELHVGLHNRSATAKPALTQSTHFVSLRVGYIAAS